MAFLFGWRSRIRKISHDRSIICSKDKVKLCRIRKISPCSLTDKVAVFGTVDEGSTPPTGTSLIFEYTVGCKRTSNLQYKLSTLAGCTKHILSEPRMRVSNQFRKKWNCQFPLDALKFPLDISLTPYV